MLIVGIAVFQLINIFGKPEKESEVIDPRPTVSAEHFLAKDYQVTISGFGSVEPLEQISLSAQVSGEVTDWHTNFVQGGLVKKGELLFSIDKTSYEAAFLQAEANLASAEASLVEQQAMAKVAQDEARENPNRTYTDFFLRKPQLLSAESAVKSALAALKIAKRDLDNTSVYAPFDALILSRNLGLGQFLMAGNQVATLYNIETAKILVPIPGFEASFLPNKIGGTEAVIRSQDQPDSAYLGVVRHVINAVNTDTRMTQVFVELDKPIMTSFDDSASQRPLKFGDYVEVSFKGKTLPQVYSVPQDLVNDDGIWLLDERSRLTESKVTVLRSEGEQLIISEGISNTDLVVVTPPEYPSEGMLVKRISAAKTEAALAEQSN